MKRIHKNIKDFRVKNGLKQEEMARLVGTTGKNWSNYELGKTEPNIEALVKLASAFKITLDALVMGDVKQVENPVEYDQVKIRSELDELNDRMLSLEQSLTTFLMAENRYLRSELKDADNNLVACRHQVEYLQKQLNLSLEALAKPPAK
ncbi:MAG: helix-turn-helix domain-containing protein [Cytophagales bacterium]|nr:helix-turn-helix domain-containing protein [Cytophagales bacterium]